MRNIFVYSGSRADYHPLYPIIKRLGGHKVISTTGTQDLEHTIRYMLRDASPDILVLLGDRYETLVAAMVANWLCIPTAHIHGGEETEGAIDNNFRHAITKLSYWHFTAHEDYSKRVIQMGEDPERVFNYGAPGIDNLEDAASREEITSELGISFIGKCVLAVYHPETLGGSIEDQAKRFIGDLDKYETVFIAGANSDKGSDIINTESQHYSHSRDNVLYRASFSKRIFNGLLRECDYLLGNSSSFIYEGLALGKEIIMLGDRQKGRFETALKHYALSKAPYGVNTSDKIVAKLMDVDIPDKPRKVFNS